MAVRGAFSSILITAQRHWWKDILNARRCCAVFSLSFDYIPNYSASKQLSKAWMLWIDSFCNRTILWAAILWEPNSSNIMLVCASDERGVLENQRSLPWLQGSVVSGWHHRALLDESVMSWFEHPWVRLWLCTCAERLSVRMVLFPAITP